MKIAGVDFQTIDWSARVASERPGECGTALWRTLEVGNVRVRLVEYSAGYRADHWCARGHVVHVLEGELTTELDDGRRWTLPSGGTYVVADDTGTHRSSSEHGARLLIVD
jgi:quercetin dioxygenase-like cupin family protein